MTIYVGADHRGFAIKELYKKKLQQQGYMIVDKGAFVYDSFDDYPDFAAAVSEDVVKEKSGKGILFCGSGVGVSIAANKYVGIRAGIGFSVKQVAAARHDDDMNVLAIPTDYVDDITIQSLLKVFLETDFSHEEKYQRRLTKVSLLEKRNNG